MISVNKWIATAWIVALVPMTAAGAPGERPLAWSPDTAGTIPHARLGPAGTLELDAPGAADLTVLQLAEPGVEQPFFGLRLRVAHSRVAPPGTIQMDVGFGPGEVYFSRLPLAGDGAWRELELPFNATAPGGGWRRPTALSLRLILPRGGRVSLEPPRLVQAASWGDLARSGGAWWSEGEAGWIGAVGGTAFGLLGALVGVLVARGRARAWALTLCWLAAGLGAAALIAGLIALAGGQGYAVYYPLLLIGGLGVVIFPLFALRSSRAYAGVELRRMRARDR